MKFGATARVCERKVGPRFRSGLELSGEVVVRTIKTGATHREYTPIGHTVNLASRLQSLATAGSTVISYSTRKLVEGYFALRPLGPAHKPALFKRAQGIIAKRFRITDAGSERNINELTPERVP